MSNYVTALEVVEGHPLLGVDQIQSDWLDVADEEINNRTGIEWAVSVSKTISVPGSGKRYIYLGVDQIATLTLVQMGDINNESLETIEAADYDIVDGYAWLKTNYASKNFRGFDVSTPGWVESGINNCHFTGTFGEATPDIIKQIAKLIVLRYAQGYHAERINWDMMSQNISNSSYKQEGRLSLEQLIDHLIDSCLDLEPENFMVLV